ncbi:MAB_1171c family putative transporter [Streptomyces zagrosensis]|uniref:DUF6545 domain-containing protein n=1 Tax=Streptomyces zagrosensis TaxID=1042984 RepID=A0A7W9QGU2_9ACTN|nr:MAB_1171c family putative transporter [Streptomyces zagrosensis]MBB5939998.1 hypothetical protein [Streptomyces zagrosensis]
MLDLVASVIVALLVGQVLWRLPSALRRPGGQRSLVGVFAAFAGAWWMRSDAGRTAVDRLGVTDLATLCKHLLTIAGVCVLMTYVTAVYAEASGSAEARHVRIAVAVRRVAVRASLAAVAVITGVFFWVLNRAHPVAQSPYFMTRHAGEVGLALYMGLFYLYVAAAALVCGYQWGSAARRAERWPLRAGLALMGGGMGLAVLYAATRAGYGVMITVREVSPSFVTAQEAVTDAMLHSAFIVWLLGVIAPAASALASRWRARRTVLAVYPLWRELALAVPDVVAYPPATLPGGRVGRWAGSVRDLTRTAPRLLLERYLTEINDAVRTLSHYAPPGLSARTTAYATRCGHTGEMARAVASAYWGRCALLALADGVPPQRAPVDAPPSADDGFEAFVARMPLVQAAYRRVNEQVARHLLSVNDAEPPRPDGGPPIPADRTP